MIRITPGKPMPPIGFNIPPQEAGHGVPIALCLTLTAAIVTVILNGMVLNAIARMSPPAVTVAPVQLNGKDQTRFVDANGNRIVATKR